MVQLNGISRDLHHSDEHIDSKRSLMSFTGRKDPDQCDLIPEDSSRPQEGYKFRGHFLDLKTLAFALTDRGHSLKPACAAFGVEEGKLEVSGHGEITQEYIAYNRRDVAASSELAEKLFRNTTCTRFHCQRQRHSRPRPSVKRTCVGWA